MHVSGHACQNELSLIHSLIKPKFFIPVHGEYRHLKRHAELAMKMGMQSSNIIICDIGNCVHVNKKQIKLGDNVTAGYLLVDGLGVGDVGSVVLRDRIHLSEDGLVCVAVSVDKASGAVSDLDVTSKGFMFVKENDDIISETKDVVMRVIEKYDLKADAGDWNPLKNYIRKELKGYLFKKTRRNPMILTMILEA